MAAKVMRNGITLFIFVVGIVIGWLSNINVGFAQPLEKINGACGTQVDANADYYNSELRHAALLRRARAYKEYNQKLKKLEPIKRQYEWQLANATAVAIGAKFSIVRPPEQ
jgi:hypothetical protein